MLEVRDILLAFVLPGAAATIVVVILRFAWRSASPLRATAAWALAIVTGLLIAGIAIVGWPRPPIESHQWVYLLIVPAGALVLAALPRLPRALSWLLGLIVAVLVPLMLNQPELRNVWSRGEATAWLAGLTAAIAAQWALLGLLHQRLAHRDGGGAMVLAMALVAGVAGVTVALSGSQVIGMIGMALAATVTGALVGAVGLKPPAAAGAASVLAWLGLASVLILGYFAAELDPVNAILIAAAPLAAWLVELPAVRRLRPWQRQALRVAVVLLPALIALTRAGLTFQQETSDPLYSKARSASASVHMT